MTYSNIFSAWRKAAGNHWTDYINHPFVHQLGTGTLPNEAFLHYLKQDYVFLFHFTRAWSLAVTKASSFAEMRLAANTASSLINEEIVLHVETCAAAGISELELKSTKERTENLAYTRYVLDAGHSGDLLDLLATLAPCVMGYGEIGTFLANNNSSDKYSEWINTYAGDPYQQVCHDVGDLINDAVAHRLGDDPTHNPRWRQLCEHFTTATQLEIRFWEMGLKP